MTQLARRIGYAAVAELAKQVHSSGTTIREICQEKAIQLEKLLDPRRQTGGVEKKKLKKKRWFTQRSQA